MGELARKNARSKYCANDVIPRYEAYYESVLNSISSSAFARAPASWQPNVSSQTPKQLRLTALAYRCARTVFPATGVGDNPPSARISAC